MPEPCLVHLIHEAALDDSLWPKALALATNACGASAGLLVCGRPQATPHLFVPVVADAALNPQFLHRHTEDLCQKLYCHHPAGTLVGSGRRRSEQALSGTALHDECTKPKGVRHWLACNVERSEEGFCHVALFRTLQRGAFTSRERRLLSVLAPHFRIACTTRRRLFDLSRQHAAALETLERVSTAVVLVDKALRVVFANQSARELAARRDGMLLEGGGFKCSSAEATSELRKGLSGAVEAGRHLSRIWEVVLPRPSGKASLLATVVALQPGALALPRRPEAAVFVVDPVSRPRDPPSPLAELFGLTHAEVQVCTAVAEGKGLMHAARKLGVSVNTVRTHLAHSLDKTQTRQQAELTRLVAHLAAQRPRPAS